MYNLCECVKAYPRHYIIYLPCTLDLNGISADDRLHKVYIELIGVHTSEGVPILIVLWFCAHFEFWGKAYPSSLVSHRNSSPDLLRTPFTLRGGNRWMKQSVHARVHQCELASHHNLAKQNYLCRLNLVFAFRLFYRQSGLFMHPLFQYSASRMYGPRFCPMKVDLTSHQFY